MTEKPLKPGWKRVKFGEVVRLSKERSSDPLADGYERYLGLDHLEPGDLRIRRWGNVADGVTFTSVFKPGQVLFGKRRAYQRKVAVADFAGVCSGDIYVFESANPKVLLPELLPFLCQTDAFFEHAVGTSAGSLSPRTNWTSLADFEFALPPLEEQRSVLSACVAWQDTLRCYEDLNNVAVRYQRSLRESVFGSDDMPITLRSLVSEIQAGKSLNGIDSAPKNSSEKAVLKVSAIGKDGFIADESKALLDQSEFLTKHSVVMGDVLITRANTAELVGLACRVDRDFPNLMLSDKTLRLVPKPNVPGELLVEALKTESARQYFKANATGTGNAMKNLSQEKILDLPILMPSRRQWSEYVLAFQKVSSTRKTLFERMASLHDTRRRVLGEIVTGVEV